MFYIILTIASAALGFVTGFILGNAAIAAGFTF